MKNLLEIGKYGCWLIGAAGLIGVYSLYSFPAHLDLPVLLAIAGMAIMFVVLGFVIHNWQKSKFL
jgi:hypothetical protein